MRRPSIWFLLASFMAVFMACRKDKLERPAGPTPPLPSSPVVFDLDEVPYPTLSTYSFFQGAMVDMQPVPGVLPYEVITPLFSDYALKKRFVWMPAGMQASYAGDHQVLDFPNGAVLIKNFFYHNVQPGNATRVIETRLLYKRNGQWAFAEYVWNDDQTEAHLDMNGSFTQVDWLDAEGAQRTVNYRIPSGGECFTCHKQGLDPVPIGPKPQNLAMSIPYTDGVMDQFVKWTSVGYLAPGTPTIIDKVARWDDPLAGLDERVRAYIDMNCAHCHAEGSHCDYRPMRFAYTETADPLNLGVCIPPEEELLPALTHIVARGNVERSMLHYRLNATDESVRMPLLGRSVVHEEAVELMAEWINSLTPACN